MLRKKETLIGGMLLFLLVAGFGWHSIISKAASNAQNVIMAKVNADINGRLTVEHIDFSDIGTLTATNVTLYDSQNNVLGTSDKVLVELGLFDLLSGNVGLHAIRSITLENPSILLLSKAGHWNWDDLFKPQTDQSFTFRGQVHVKQGGLTLNTPDNRKLEVINGNVDFTKYPALAFDMTGKSGDNPLAMKGSWNFKGEGTLDFTSEHIALTDLPLEHLLPTDFQISDGTVKDLILTVVKQANKLSVSSEGSLENFAANVNGFTLNDGNAKFKLAEGKLNLWDTSLLLNGQRVALDGALFYDTNGLNLNLNATSSSFDPSVLADWSLQGPLTFQAQLEGLAANPVLEGTFAQSQGNFGPIAFSNANGYFSYNTGILAVTGTTATAWNGTISINGNLIPASQQYNLNIHGSGLDAGLLTDKEIKGSVDFDARLSAQGADADSLNGNFQMGEGSFSGIPCQSITGNFAKQGSQVYFSNINVRTAIGVFRADGVTEGSIVKLRKGDLLPSARDLLDKAVSGQLK